MSNKNQKKNKDNKQSNISSSGKYEFANDQLGENSENQYKKLNSVEKNNKKRGK
jgi:hypothetical protein